jgi:predicted RNA binding protein YcfA (HicA-like mRNA interferase family)
MRPLTAREIERVLLLSGFVLARERGSHKIFRNPTSRIIVPVPFHGGTKPIPIGTFLAIVRQSKLPKISFTI